MTTGRALFAGHTADHFVNADRAMANAIRISIASGLRIERDLGEYLREGSVVVRPDMVLLYRPTVKARPDEWLDEPGAADAWYVRLLVGRGSLRTAIEEMPYILPWCCWHRNLRCPGGPVHFARTERIINILRK